MALVLLSIWAGDHPRLVRDTRSQDLLLDRAFTDQRGLVAHLEGILAAHVDDVSIRRTDLVNDTTLVRVRYRPDRTTVRASEAKPARVEVRS